MGGGSYTTTAFVNYSKSTGKKVGFDGAFAADSKLQDFYKQRQIHKDLNPYGVTRECCDSEEHPNTIPVILGLDVTGSMGKACLKTATSLNKIMTDCYDKFKDIEFLMMGIGDLAYDDAPIQFSQFESDVRIAEHLDKIYMEHGGGGNGYESYTAAWYMGVRHCKLDCWKRGKKGIIITMGDEPLNPYLPARNLSNVTGDGLEADIETGALYKEASEKFDIYHIAIADPYSSYGRYRIRIEKSFIPVLGERFKEATLDLLPDCIISCIQDSTGIGAEIKMDNDNDVTKEENNNIMSSGKITW